MILSPGIRRLARALSGFVCGALVLPLVAGMSYAAPAPNALGSGLAAPPAGAETWSITADGARFGQSHRWIAADGARWSRDSLLDRGYALEIDQKIRLAPDGQMRELTIRGSTSNGDAAESFQLGDGRYAFHSPVDEGSGVARRGARYVPFGGTIDATFLLAEALKKAPGRNLGLMPSGRAQMEPLATVQVKRGDQVRTLTAEVITGVDLSPEVVWFDGDRAFGMVGSLNFLPEGWESVASTLVEAQTTALARRAPQVLAKVAPRVTTPVAFVGVRLYDAEGRIFREDMTVVVADGRIAAVGSSSAIRPPNGAQIVRGAGKTLLPGLWDSHKHYGDDGTGALLLSQGITSIRDMGTTPKLMADIRKRITAGELLGPRIMPLLMVDGPGPQADFVAVTAEDEAGARAVARRAKAEGYVGVKIYGSLDPALIAPLADEAHRLGLRVQGHLPRTVRPLDAVRAGYDELTHINFVLMQAMPDSVVDEPQGLKQRHYGPARLAADVDLNGPVMGAYLGELASRRVTVDPTLVAFERLWGTDPGQMPPAYAPFAGTLPPQFERALKKGGLAGLADTPRARMRQGFEKLESLVQALHGRGVLILAGSDGYGIELVRELELYVQAGFSSGEAMAAATIVPARALGLDGETGSLAVGKLAELVLVDGDPSRRIGDLRRVDLVMRDGRMMRASDLRAAAGISGAPR